MLLRRFRESKTKKSFKIAVAIIVYLLFTLFSVRVYHGIQPAYAKVQDFFAQHILSDKRTVVVGNVTLVVDIADTVEKQQQGLSGREQLSAQSGMLFIFDKPDTYGFWMKDMNFAIDIIWFNEFGEAIYILPDVAPETYPETFRPPRESLYVLEVPAGFAKQHGIKVGDKIDLY